MASVLKVSETGVWEEGDYSVLSIISQVQMKAFTLDVNEILLFSIFIHISLISPVVIWAQKWEMIFQNWCHPPPSSSVRTTSLLDIQHRIYKDCSINSYFWTLNKQIKPHRCSIERISWEWLTAKFKCVEAMMTANKYKRI